MEARAMMPSEGFSGLAAKVTDVLENRRQMQAQAAAQVRPGGNSRISGLQQACDGTNGVFPGASWDGNRLLLAYQRLPEQIPEQAPEQQPEQQQSQAWSGATGQVKPGNDWSADRSLLVLDFGHDPAVWDPKARLDRAARRFLRGISDRKVPGLAALATEVRGLLAEAYAAGRRAEGLHGSGAFAAGFKRLQAHPDFPAVAVGFGPGTTPAGDDWLAGCLVALDLRAGGLGKAALDHRQKIRGRIEQTASAGRALLLGALAGAPPEYLVALAEAAADWVAVALDARVKVEAGLGTGGLWVAVSKCLEHGATSGEDALAGFVYGLENCM